MKRVDSDKLIDEQKLSLLTDLHDIGQMMLPYLYFEASLLNERKYILDELKTENFDIAMIDAIYSQMKVPEYLKLPYMQQIFYLP